MRKVLTQEQRIKNRLREKALMDSGARADTEMGRTIDYIELLARLYAQRRAWDFRRVTGMIHNKYVRMLEAAAKQDVVRPYLEDFAERYTDKLYILSMHNAALRTMNDGSAAARVVTAEDVGRAWIVVKTCMVQFFRYVTEIAWAFESLHRRNVRMRVQP
jgi:hypothetical protein